MHQAKLQVQHLLQVQQGAGPGAQPAELFTQLLQTPAFSLEHIVSMGAASPPGFWYDQPDPEWVMLAQGSAELEVEEDGAVQTLSLRAGDALTIPARLRHRVAATSADAVWLALHFKPG